MIRLKELRKKSGLSQVEFAKKINVAQNTVSNWENGNRVIDSEKAIAIANFFGVTTDYLLGKDENPTVKSLFPEPNVTEDYVTFPVIGEIAASYDHVVNEDWNGETVDIPISCLNGRPKSDFFVLHVKGDSMYPLYHDGDTVLILKQSTLNASGDIGAVIYDDEIATLKKVEYVYGEDWMRLVPINPNIPPTLIEGERLEHCRVLGIPKLLIRKFP